MRFSAAPVLYPALRKHSASRSARKRLLLAFVAAAATAWVNGAVADRGAAERRDRVEEVSEAIVGLEGAGGQALAFERPRSTHVALRTSGAGSLLINASLGGRQEAFLLDTGAAMVTISGRLHRQLESDGQSTPVREVAARMADGRMRTMSVHRVARMEIGGGCVLRDVEVLVTPGEGRNLLGLNALSSFAPITLNLQPMSLELSNCAPPVRVATQASTAAVLPVL